jgi:hypothetical protein
LQTSSWLAPSMTLPVGEFGVCSRPVAPELRTATPCLVAVAAITPFVPFPDNAKKLAPAAFLSDSGPNPRLSVTIH